MREIIHIGLGNCGVRIGCKLYEQLVQEYQIESNRICEKPAEGIEVHFSEIADKKFVPRSILYSRDVEQILANPQSLIFNPNNYQLDVHESLRKELEICNNCQGLQITHHLSTDLSALNQILQESDYPIQTFTVFPDNGHDAIRSALNMQYLEACNIVAFDNYGLNEQFAKSYKSSVTYSDYNNMIATVINGTTTPMRSNSNYTLQHLYSMQSKMNVEVCKLLQDKQSLINLQQIQEIKPLIETDPANIDKVIQVSLFARSSQLNTNYLHQQLQQSSKTFYNNILNLNYQITPYKQEVLISLLKSSHIKYKLEQMRQQLSKTQTRKAFDELYNWNEQAELTYLDGLISICNEIINTHEEQQQQQPPQQQPVIASSPISQGIKRNETKDRVYDDQIKLADEQSPKKQISFQQNQLNAKSG